MRPMVSEALHARAADWPNLHRWERSELGKELRRLSLSYGEIRDLIPVPTGTHHDPTAEFVLALHLHEGNDEKGARSYWAGELDLPGVPIHKTYIKPRGTGHRKSSLPQGVCRVLMRRSTDAWLRTLVWIRVLAKASS